VILITNRIFTYVFTVVFLLAVGFFAYLQNVYILLAPLGFLAILFFIQHPEYLFYFLLLSIPWSIEYNFTPSLGTDLPDEPLMLLTAFASVILIIFYRKRIIQFQQLHSLLFILLLQLVWIVFTAITSTGVLLSVKHLLAKCWYLLAFVAMPLFLFKDEKFLKRSALVLMISMSIFVFYALYAHKQYNYTFENINDALAPFFRNHVNYSALLVFIIPIQIAAIQLSHSKWQKLFFGCIFFVCLVALYLSYARGAWLALFTGTATYILIRQRLLFFSLFVFIFLGAGAVIWLAIKDHYLKFSNDFNKTIFHTNFNEHIAATYNLKDASTAERFHRWVAGARMAEEKWQTGFGPSTFYSQYKSYTQPAFKTWVSKNVEKSTVHNYFLLMMIEQGVVGLLLFLTLLAALFWYVQTIYYRTKERMWKIIIAAVGAILMMECTVNFLSDMIETDKAGSIFYLCVAVVIVADIKTRTQTNAAIFKN
jgi:O-antigen ligase